jgi:hypothetical protein
MACGPVDRRADRAEPARAGPGQEKPAPVRARPAAGRAFHGRPAGLKKNTKFKNECIDTQVVCLKFIYVFYYLREVISDFSEF